MKATATQKSSFTLYVLGKIILVNSVYFYVLRFGGFYVLAKSGVDIVSLLQALSVPEYYLGTLHQLTHEFRSIYIVQWGPRHQCVDTYR